MTGRVLFIVGLLWTGSAVAAGPRPWASKVPREAARLKNPLPNAADTIAAGKTVYTNTCMPCHGETAQGDGPASQFINPKPKPLVNGTSLSLPDGVIFWVISNGIDGTGMAAFKETMSEKERWQAIAYLHSLKSGGAPPVEKPAPAETPAVVSTSGAAAASTIE